jgi:hypothetical protein
MHRWPHRKFQGVIVCYEYVSRVFKVRFLDVDLARETAFEGFFRRRRLTARIRSSRRNWWMSFPRKSQTWTRNRDGCSRERKINSL